MSIDAFNQYISTINLFNTAITTPHIFVLPITSSDSTEAIAIACHINFLSVKCKVDRDIGFSAALSCKPCCRNSCCVVLYQIRTPVLRCITTNTCISTPIRLIRKLYRRISFGCSDSFIGCSTRFAILVRIDHLVCANISIVSGRIHSACTAIHYCR